MEKKLWEVIANQCAPVLADVKPSNLLILTPELTVDGFIQSNEYLNDAIMDGDLDGFINAYLKMEAAPAGEAEA